MKVPYMPVVGDQEAAAGTVSLRKRDGSRVDSLPLDEFITMVTERITTRASAL